MDFMATTAMSIMVDSVGRSNLRAGWLLKHLSRLAEFLKVRRACTNCRFLNLFKQVIISLVFVPMAKICLLREQTSNYKQELEHIADRQWIMSTLAKITILDYFCLFESFIRQKALISRHLYFIVQLLHFNSRLSITSLVSSFKPSLSRCFQVMASLAIAT